jgi:hypothetical protein
MKKFKVKDRVYVSLTGYGLKQIEGYGTIVKLHPSKNNVRQIGVKIDGKGENFWCWDDSDDDYIEFEEVYNSPLMKALRENK